MKWKAASPQFPPVLVSLIVSFVSLIGALGIFSVTIMAVAKGGVGSFLGSGQIAVNVPGETTRLTLMSTWGPDSGFSLCLVAIILVFILVLIAVKRYRATTHPSPYQSRKHLVMAILKKGMPFIGIVLLLYLIFSIGTDKIVTTFLQLSPFYIVGAALLTFPRILIRNYGWQLILKQQKIEVSFGTSLKIFLIGYFYGSVTPGYSGQLMRIPYLKEKTDQPTGKLFVNTLVEEIIHTFSLYLMMIIGAFILIEYIPAIFPLACIFVGVSLIIYWFFINRDRGEKTFHFLIRFLAPKNLKLYFIRFVATFYQDFPNLKDLIYPFVVVIPTWIIIYSQIYILGLSLGIDIPYLVFLVIYPIANIVSFIPITSAGLGTREATVIFLLSFFGVSPEKAIVLSLAGHLLTDVLTGLYGLGISFFEARTTKKSLTDLEQLLDGP